MSRHGSDRRWGAPEVEPIDTSLPGVSATDKKAGQGHTAPRNEKENTAGMTQALEDSATGRPSRKSTRSGAPHQKPDAPLTLKTRNAVQAPQARARRAQARAR